MHVWTGAAANIGSEIVLRSGLPCVLHHRHSLGDDTVLAMQVAHLLPLNSLRNAALLLAASPLVFPLDLDMLISRELSTIARHVNRCAIFQPL